MTEWHAAPLLQEHGLPGVVAEMMTETTTRSLPPAWHGKYTLQRAEALIAELDEESATLLISLEGSGEPVGLVIVFEMSGDEPAGIELRLGYILRESMWGRGFATEMVEGFVGWCRVEPSIRSITAGVAQDNAASARVLISNGFVALDEPPDGEQIFRISFSE